MNYSGMVWVANYRTSLRENNMKDNDILICEMQQKIDNLQEFKDHVIMYVPHIGDKIKYMVGLQEKLHIATEALEEIENNDGYRDEFNAANVAFIAILEIQRIDGEPKVKP